MTAEAGLNEHIDGVIARRGTVGLAVGVVGRDGMPRLLLGA